MKILLVTIHIIVSLLLILIILLQKGKGTGLASAFGGGLPSTFGGTSQIEKNIFRITVVLALIFLITSLSLAKVL